MNTGPVIPPLKGGPVVEISLDNLCANFALLKNEAPDAEAAAVVKCNAYGLGATKIAQTLATREGVRSFFVIYAEEGAALREALADIAPEATIYALLGPLDDNIALLKEARITPVINSLEQAERWAADAPGAPCAVHMNTGMNRLGAPSTEFAAIASLGALNVELAMSHLACGSNPAHPKNNAQREAFIEAAAHFPSARQSLAASAGVLMDANYHFDLNRLGIALYGGSPFDCDAPLLKPVATLKAPIIQIMNLKPGESVGYGASFVAEKPTRIATVALGYGDGFPISGSGRAKAAINGRAATIAGRISMDLISLDITDLRETPAIGAFAEFFGPTISLFSAAQNCATSPYELLTGLGGRVDRRYV